MSLLTKKIIIGTIIIAAGLSLAFIFTNQPVSAPTEDVVIEDQEESIEGDEQQQEETSRPADGEEPKSLLELLVENPETEETLLVAVDGSSSSGIAYRVFEDGVVKHAVTANMPDPAEGNKYEGWLVQPEPLKFFSTGVMEKDMAGNWTLEYEADAEYRSYYRVVITEETAIDETPEEHIIEGDF
ncbi:MAG: hypothetical protein R3346_04170 [Candidatus Spechtbacterales bacterium]|nr:hypothetical protein [Candidatus Spechtbacterales bacterium]